MRLIDDAGHGVDLRVTGYQFPDADDLAQRHSWHMVEGTAVSLEGSWTFRYPALTCDDSQYVSTWLRATARTGSSPASAESALRAGLAFTEPNLTIAVDEYLPGLVTLDIGLDLEFSPPWRRRERAGTPFVIRTQLSPHWIERAAAEWDQEIAPYPGHG